MDFKKLRTVLFDYIDDALDATTLPEISMAIDDGDTNGAESLSAVAGREIKQLKRLLREASVALAESEAVHKRLQREIARLP